MKACLNNNRNVIDYEFVEYQPSTTRGDESNWHSTKLESNANSNTTSDTNRQLEFSSQCQLDNNKHLAEKYKLTRRLIKQQTQSLVRSGYYTTYDESMSSSGQSSLSSSYSTAQSSMSTSCCSKCRESNSYCSTCYSSSSDESSTQFLAGIVTTTKTSDFSELDQDESRSSDQDDFSSDYCSIHSDQPSKYAIPSYAESTKLDHTNNTTKPQVMVCCLEIRSTIDGDLSLKYGDKVKLIHESKTNEYLLVQKLANGQCGLVPKQCLTSLENLIPF